MTALPPVAGPELDACLAKALGWTYVGLSEVDGCYEGEPPAGTDRWYPPARVTRRLDQYVGIPQFSTDVSAAISAAEEARKAGRIRYWELGLDREARPFANISNGSDECIGTAWGKTVAHALSLALCAALEVEK